LASLKNRAIFQRTNPKNNYTRLPKFITGQPKNRAIFERAKLCQPICGAARKSGKNGPPKNFTHNL
jgi:hypothetical protein